MDEAFHALAEVLFVHLQRQYEPDMNERNAMALATTITFILLGPPPADTKGLRSLSTDSHGIEMKLDQIKNDPDVCMLVSQFRHMRDKVTSTIPSDILAADTELTKLGIMLPAGLVLLPTSYSGLMRKVREFEERIARG